MKGTTEEAMFIILIDFIYFSSLIRALLSFLPLLLFPITHRKVILKAGDLEHRCVRYKGSYPQRHSNWLKETPPNGVAKDPAFVHLFVSRLSYDSLFNFWSLECLCFNSTCTSVIRTL